jgi:hypothetical protein
VEIELAGPEANGGGEEGQKGSSQIRVDPAPAGSCHQRLHHSMKTYRLKQTIPFKLAHLETSKEIIGGRTENMRTLFQFGPIHGESRAVEPRANQEVGILESVDGIRSHWYR